MPLVVCPELPTIAHALVYFYTALAPRWAGLKYGQPALAEYPHGHKQVLVKRNQESEVWGEGNTWTAACTQALNATKPIKKLLSDGSVTYFL